MGIGIMAKHARLGLMIEVKSRLIKAACIGPYRMREPKKPGNIAITPNSNSKKVSILALKALSDLVNEGFA